MGSFSFFHWLISLIALSNIAMIIHIAVSPRSEGGKKIGFLVAQLIIPFVPYFIWLGVRNPEPNKVANSRPIQHNFVPADTFTNSVVRTSTHQATPSSVVDEDVMYSEIAQEIESGTVKKGLWTRLYAQSSGDENRTKVLYIQERARQIVSEKLKDIEHLETSIVNTKLETNQARESFLAGKSLTQRQVKLLVQASKIDNALTSLRDRVRGRTLLHWCYEFHLDEEIDTLLKSGADANAPDGNGNIPSALQKNTGNS